MGWCLDVVEIEIEKKEDRWVVLHLVMLIK